MPQLNKGGKYVFGWSVIGADGTIHFPTMALSEYNLTSEPEIIIFTGSKITGGFCVTNQRMLLSSKLKTILDKGIMPSEKVLDFPVDCNTLTGSVNL